MASLAQSSTRERRRIRVSGTVQGVGFRPFVHRLAVALDVDGWVRNDSAGVLIDVEGEAADLDRLLSLLTTEPPRLARIDTVSVEVDLPLVGGQGFAIAATDGGGPPTTPVGIDTATCPACLAEIFDPADRRYRYPFTNCTDCGPRYTIVRAVPYDRPATTMAGFAMCRACQAEYDDPTDRRFHAQPNACPACGPTLTWRHPDGRPLATGDDALARATETLGRGGIIALKGIGGYHLAVDATSDRAVRELRRRKHRDAKPFAVMVADEAAATALAELGDTALASLGGAGRPVVLAPVRPGVQADVRPGVQADVRPDVQAGVRAGALAHDVAPGLAEVGLLLPYSPLHHLLLASVDRPLVMTSGNLSDEPIAHDDDDAVERLGPLVDGLLTHDRPIHIRCDDSVVRAHRGGVQVLRRSRGFAPEPVRLPGLAPRPTSRPILAVGAELKSTVAVARDGFVVASHHIGDLEHLPTYRSFLQAIDHLCHLYGIEPEVVAHDLHPEHLSTKLAHDLGLPLVGVQHHHAHVASCLVDNERDEVVVALAFDGTGYGTDDTLWGGEVLVADLARSERVGHLRPIVLPGGSAAIREPWRMAAAWLAEAGSAMDPPASVDERRRAGVDAVIASGRGPGTTSMGRLFDAIGSTVTGRTVASYEAQAAIELEALARGVARRDAPAWAEAMPIERTDGQLVLDPRPLVVAVVDAVRAGTAPAVVAARAHETIGRSAAALALEAASQHGIGVVALTGGVFQNARLTEVVDDALTAAGVEVLVHHRIPANDGGISVGQAAVAARGGASPASPWQV